MATVKIKLSQDVIDQEHALDVAGGSLDGSPGSLLSGLGAMAATGSGQPTWTYSGDLTAHYSDGTVEDYGPMVFDNGWAGSGHASASNYTLSQQNLTITAAGAFNFDYGHTLSAAGDTVWFAPRSSVVNYLWVETYFPATSPDYDPMLGNLKLMMHGAMTVSSTGELGGTLSSIYLSPEKFISSINVDGNFTMSNDSLGGVLTGYGELYRDSSSISIQGLSADVSKVDSLGQGMLDDSGYFGGSDDISVDLPARLHNDVMISAGAGDDRISLKGGGGQLGVQAGAGNDQITLLGDAHTVDGGGGIDTVILNSTRAGTSLQHVAPADASQSSLVYTLTDSSGAVSQLTNVERVAFADVTVALDIDGNGGQAYRLYQAAFNRTPDMAGLGYWIGALDHGQSLEGVAQGFVNSAEFQAAYGTSPSNSTLVTRFYENILHRAPEQAGLDYWVGLLDNKQASVAGVLMGISESAENKTGLIGVIGNGFEFTPYH